MLIIFTMDEFDLGPLDVPWAEQIDQLDTRSPLFPIQADHVIRAANKLEDIMEGKEKRGEEGLENATFVPPPEEAQNGDVLDVFQELVNETLIRTKEYNKLLREKRINEAEYNRLFRLKSGRKASGKNSWTKYADNPQNRAIDRVGKVRKVEAV